MKTCTVSDCTRPLIAKGHCTLHYQRAKRGADLCAPVRSRGQCANDFFRLLVQLTDDCIIWPHGTNSAGYGRLKINGVTWLTHRLALQLFAGEPATPDLIAGHGPCHNPLCMNAHGGHVTWITERQNQRDRHRDGTQNRSVVKS